MLAEHENPIVKLIEDYMKPERYNKIENLQTAYDIYEFGTDNIVEYGDITNAIKTLTQQKYAGESTITRLLVHENERSLSTWAKDERCVNLEAPKQVEDEKPVDPKDLDDLERSIREDIHPADISYFFIQLLIGGFAVASCGLKDIFYVPNSKDVTIDYMNHKYVCMKRKLEVSFVKTLVEMAEAGEETNYGKWNIHNEGEFLLEYEDETMEVDVEHGQIKIGRKEFIEFVKYNGAFLYRILDKPIMFTQCFEYNAVNKEPMGLYAVFRAEELKAIKLKLAISSRITEAIKASMLIASGSMTKEQAQELYSGSVLPVAKSAFTNPQGKAFEHVPSRVEEIPVYVEELNRVEHSARMATGLYKRQVEVSTSETSATESSIVFVNATEKQRALISAFSTTMGKVMECIALRDYSIELKAMVVYNPLDEELRLKTLDEVLPVAMELVKSDPDGALFGGIVNVRTIQQLIVEKFRAGKLDVGLLNPPSPTTLQDMNTMAEAQKEKKEAADVIAQAEALKAQAAMLKAQVEEAKLDVEMGKHTDEILIAMKELEIKMIELKLKGDLETKKLEAQQEKDRNDALQQKAELKKSDAKPKK